MHTSTYRIQFNRSFPFGTLEKYAGYLEKLGITTLYASPILQSTPGSMHGYDVTDPLSIDPELGGAEGFERLHEHLYRHQIGWIQDIVPNHMAFNHHNTWLWDVLEYGRESEFAPVFDIDWGHPEFEGKLMVPFLGKPFEDAVRDEEIGIIFQGGKFHFNYFDNLFPVNPEGFFHVCLKDNVKWHEELQPVFELMETTKIKERLVGPPWEVMITKIDNLYQTSPLVREWIDQSIEAFLLDRSNLHVLHNMQHYRLCYWRRTENMINYRRFFTVNSLICLRMEDRQVFDRYHVYLKDLIDKNMFIGLRIDHIDGLRDPGGYLDRLRELTGENSLFLVEKILELREDLPEQWDVQGTTGYEFLAIVNNLFTNQQKYPLLADFYDSILPGHQDLDAVIYAKKRFILFERMGGELDNLCRELYTSGLIPDIRIRETGFAEMRDALAAFLIGFPVYRLYVSQIPPEEQDAVRVKDIVESAIKREPSLENELKMLLDLFMGKFGHPSGKNEQIVEFFKRCMQFTGPLMAKGVEDTTMYYFHQFIAHNEVGDRPDSAGFSTEEFHRAMLLRMEKWPLAMNATSTHDTKRGEDTRARLNVISDLAGEWIDLVKKWFEMNGGYKKTINGKIVPTANEEYLIYQTLAGVWPFEKQSDESLNERLRDYFIKAMREAKTHTTWNEPAEAHESAVIEFIHTLLDPDKEFYSSFNGFLKKIGPFGILNSLVQVVLKSTCPGIPDIYRGCEMWDFSLVDPDNRRPVDYQHRINRLDVLSGEKKLDGFIENMIRDIHSGDLKLWFTHVLLHQRKSDPDLFLQGKYIPVEIRGNYRKNFLTFARKHGSRWLVVVVPLHLATLHMNWNEIMDENMDWKDTELIMPQGTGGNCLEVLTGRKMSTGSILKLNDVFMGLPMSVLVSL